MYPTSVIPHVYEENQFRTICGVMLLMGTCLAGNYVVLILLYSINSSFAQPTQQVLEKSEVAPSKPGMKLKDAYEPLLSFFRPTTCRRKGGQTLIPCHVGEGLNRTECLKNKCCPSKTSHELTCYMPFKDNVQLTFRLLVLVAGGFFILGCLPFCCNTFFQRSQCVNPLRRANKEIQQIVRKKRAHSEEVYDPLLD
ncbi:FMR1 neighbor protein [Falco peregrinus]|uniref:FMR1 neighbor protein n=1 Tax=Falco peregrinus TaxID=8954 RepID=UPI00247A10AD|nr:FMR1 neighbor protein [Falco peregrinus]